MCEAALARGDPRRAARSAVATLSRVAYRRAMSIRRHALLVALAGASTLASCGEGNYADDRLVMDYCVYRSDTYGQYESCRNRISVAFVKQSDSNAARWARDGGDCLEDAGAMCEEALEEERQAYEDYLRSEGCEPAAYSGGRGGC